MQKADTLSSFGKKSTLSVIMKKAIIILAAIGIIAGGAIFAIASKPRREITALPKPTANPAVLNESGNTQITFTISNGKRLRKTSLQLQDGNGAWKTVARLNDKGKSGDAVKKDRIYTAITDISGQKAILRVTAKKGLRKLLVSKPLVLSTVPPGFKLYQDPDISLAYPENMVAKQQPSNPGSKLRSIEFSDTSSDNVFMVDIFQLDKDQTIIEYADEGEWVFPEPWQNVFEVIDLNGMTVLRSKLPSWQFIWKQKHYEITNGIPGWEEGVHNLDDPTFQNILNSITLP